MEQSDILRNLRIEQLTPMQEAAQDAYQSDQRPRPAVAHGFW